MGGGASTPSLGRQLLTAAAEGDAVTINEIINKAHEAGTTEKVCATRDKATGNSALHVAVDRNHTPAALNLLSVKSAKFLVTLVNAAGQTPLHVAAAGGHTALARAIAFASCREIQVKDKSGSMPLHLLCASTSTTEGDVIVAATSLLEASNTMFHKQPCGWIDGAGRTPLHLATMANNVKLVEMLVARDPSPALVQDDEGRTPLHYAAALESLDLVQALLVASEQPLIIADGDGLAPKKMVSSDCHNNKLLRLLWKSPGEPASSHKAKGKAAA